MRATLGRAIRYGLLVALLTVVSVPVFAGSASAKGKPAVATLVCPSSVVTATATVTLAGDVNGVPLASDPVPISCTSGQTSEVRIKPTSQPAPAFTYSITWVGGVSGNCTSGGWRDVNTITITCATTGAPTLTVS